MPTYEIINDADVKDTDSNNVISPVKTSINTCRRLCNDYEDCEAFVYRQDDEICHLKTNLKDSDRYYRGGSTLHMKRGNSNYMVLWFILTLVIVFFFIAMCKGL